MKLFQRTVSRRTSFIAYGIAAILASIATVAAAYGGSFYTAIATAIMLLYCAFETGWWFRQSQMIEILGDKKLSLIDAINETSNTNEQQEAWEEAAALIDTDKELNKVS